MIIVVAGLGRCGSSLTMQMLKAGGIPVSGKAPAFETDICHIAKQQPAKLQSGTAYKILLPHLYRFIPGDYRSIWLDRDPLENAKSQYKFIKMVTEPATGREIISPEEKGKPIVNLMNRYSDDRALGIKAVQKIGPVLELTFEDSIMFPERSAKAIAKFLKMDLNIKGMASIVIPRSIECTSNMNIEAKLMQEAILEERHDT